MSVAVVVDLDAAAEFDEAMRWYEAERPGLGDDFRDAVGAAFARLRDPAPFIVQSLARVRGHVVHRVFLYRFLYRVVFVDGADVRRVLAVMRHGRADRTWKRRL